MLWGERPQLEQAGCQQGSGQLIGSWLLELAVRPKRQQAGILRHAAARLPALGGQEQALLGRMVVSGVTCTACGSMQGSLVEEAWEALECIQLSQHLPACHAAVPHCIALVRTCGRAAGLTGSHHTPQGDNEAAIKGADAGVPRRGGADIGPGGGGGGAPEVRRPHDGRQQLDPRLGRTLVHVQAVACPRSSGEAAAALGLVQSPRASQPASTPVTKEGARGCPAETSLARWAPCPVAAA